MGGIPPAGVATVNSNVPSVAPAMFSEVLTLTTSPGLNGLVGRKLARTPAPSHIADAVGMGLPTPLRWLWPRLARDPLFAVVMAGLTEMFRAGVRLGHLGLEAKTARAIGSLEIMRGVVERS